MSEGTRSHGGERLRRWRLVLGDEAGDGTGARLTAEEAAMDRCLAALYGRGGDDDGDRQGGLGASAPSVSRWLGDIRRYFPASVVRVMQKDALDRLGIGRMLLEPELLESVVPDVHLVATLVSLGRVIPARTKDTARRVVRGVVEEVMKRLAEPTREAVRGAINRAARTRRPRASDIDWHRTIRRNLRHYQPEHRTVVPETLVGFGRRRSALRDVILCVDQSGSMASSVVYSGIFAAVLASLPSVRTRLIVFDTSVVDLTDELAGDPVDVLFGLSLGGGTDIDRAIAYARGFVERPAETVLFLVTDLYEGGDGESLLGRIAELKAAGVNVVTLLALSDDGAPAFDRERAADFAALEVPTFACTPDAFPDLLAAALDRRDLADWAAVRDIPLVRGEEGGRG